MLMAIFTALVGLVSIFLLLSATVWNTMHDSNGKRLKGIPSLFRSITDILPIAKARSNHKITSLLEGLFKSSNSQIMAFQIFLRRVVLIRDPQFAGTVLRGGYDKYPKAQIYQTLEFAAGQGLITANGDLWRNQRRLLNKSFHVGIVKAMLNKVARHSVEIALIIEGGKDAESTCDRKEGRMVGRDPLTKGSKDEEAYVTVDCFKLMPAFTFDVLMDTVFSNPQSNSKYGTNSNLFECFNVFLEEINQRFWDPSHRISFLNPERTKRVEESLAFGIDYARSALKKREEERRALSESEIKRGNEGEFAERHQDLLDVVLNARDFEGEDENEEDNEEQEEKKQEGGGRKRRGSQGSPSSSSDFNFSDKLITDNMVTFLLAGHETTSSLIQWTLTLLSDNPQYQDKLYEEARDVLGDAVASLKRSMEEGGEDDAPPSSVWEEAIEGLVWTRAIMNESLRLRPPISMYGRTCNVDTALSRTAPSTGKEESYFFKKGFCDILIHAHAIHRNPEYWDRPDDFYPERWFDKDVLKNPYQFIPFSAGPRNCIGQQFARYEGLLFLAIFFLHFRVELHPSADVNNYETVTSRPADLYVKAYLR